jgi:hypothetical protein
LSFLCSTEDRFFVPTCQHGATLRADAVKAGRFSNFTSFFTAARPRLDDGEHSVILPQAGPRPPS